MKKAKASKSTIKRNRHGRIVDGEISTAEEMHEFVLSTPLAELDRIARKVFVDRNAKGYPQIYRAAAKAKARPALRSALNHAALARTALLRGKKHEFELERLYAHLELANAAVGFRQAYINTYTKRQADRVPKQRRKFSDDTEIANVAEIVQSLAAATDTLGDYMHVKDIWPELYSRLDQMGLDPVEETDAGGDPLLIRYDGGKVMFSSFKTMVSKARKS
jgi:hypothetical protein